MSQQQIILVLHNIRSMHNVGSIFRTADAAGVEKIYLCGITPSPLDRFGKVRVDFKKVSLGAEKTVAWDASVRSVRDVQQLFTYLKAECYNIFAVEQSPRSIPYYQAKWKNKKIALVLGNEREGVPQSIFKIADRILEIPMHGKKESLNVAVACGIVLFRLRFP